jgi:drug/metabolite transporter (DMT)-like permease
VSLNAVGIGVGGLMLLVLTFVFGETIALPESALTWLAQVYLILIGSVVGFTLYVFVLNRWTASAVSYEGVLIPIVAILLATWLQDERITWAFGIGAILVLIGVYVGALRQEAVEDRGTPEVASEL